MPDDPRPGAQPAPEPPKAPDAPPERKAPGFPGEARPGAVPPPRDDVDATTGEIVGEAPRKPFSQFLIEQRNGGLHAEISDALANVVKSVQDHAKPGSLSLTISVKPGAKGTYTLVVTDDVKVKVPRGERPAAMFFADEDGNLCRNDPRQQELPLRRVEVGQGADLRRASGGDAR